MYTCFCWFGLLWIGLPVYTIFVLYPLSVKFMLLVETRTSNEVSILYFPQCTEECTVPFVLAYDDLLSGPFKTFFECSMKIGGDVAAIAKLVQDTFINQRAFLVMASKSQRPLDTELPQVSFSTCLPHLCSLSYNRLFNLFWLASTFHAKKPIHMHYAC